MNDKYIDPRDLEDSLNFGYHSPEKKDISKNRREKQRGSKTMYKSKTSLHPLIPLSDMEANQSNYQGGLPGMNSSNLFSNTNYQSGFKSSYPDFGRGGNFRGRSSSGNRF